MVAGNLKSIKCLKHYFGRNPKQWEDEGDCKVCVWGGAVFLALDQPKPKSRVGTWDGEKKLETRS